MITGKQWLLHWGQDGFIALLDSKDPGWEEEALNTCNSYLPNHLPAPVVLELGGVDFYDFLSLNTVDS